MKAARIANVTAIPKPQSKPQPSGDGAARPPCPYCGSANVKRFGHTDPLKKLGGIRQQRFKCNDCGKRWQV